MKDDSILLIEKNPIENNFENEGKKEIELEEIRYSKLDEKPDALKEETVVENIKNRSESEKMEEKDNHKNHQESDKFFRKTSTTINNENLDDTDSLKRRNNKIQTLNVPQTVTQQNSNERILSPAKKASILKQVSIYAS